MILSDLANLISHFGQDSFRAIDRANKNTGKHIKQHNQTDPRKRLKQLVRCKNDIMTPPRYKIWLLGEALGQITVSVSVFTAQCICIARTMPSHDVCLSVTRRYSVKTVTPILKFISPQGSRTVLVFPVPNGIEIFRRLPHIPLTGASNARWVCKNHVFRPISCFISEIMQDKAIVIFYGRRKAFEWYQFE